MPQSDNLDTADRPLPLPFVAQGPLYTPGRVMQDSTR
ncbi:uncharacterized protein METZ01_LOCUS401186, partial [marine metagenome]